jgi:hypothetical protein
VRWRTVLPVRCGTLTESQYGLSLEDNDYAENCHRADEPGG